jgi:hypothetical protein
MHGCMHDFEAKYVFRHTKIHAQIRQIFKHIFGGISRSQIDSTFLKMMNLDFLFT